MRRAFVWLGLAMLGLAAPPAASEAADLEKVRVSIIPIGDVAPLFAAVQQGYFREVGLEIDTTPSAGGAAGIPGLVGGSFDIAYGNVVSALLAAQQGLDVKVIAAGTNVTDPKLDARESSRRAIPESRAARTSKARASLSTPATT